MGAVSLIFGSIFTANVYIIFIKSFIFIVIDINFKSTNSNRKWEDIDINGRSLHTLERKGAVAKFTIPIFSEYDCLTHPLMRTNLIESHIYVLCNQNSIMNSEHLF